VCIQKSELPFRGYVRIGVAFADDNFQLLEINLGRKGGVATFPLPTLVQNGTSTWTIGVCGGDGAR